jgi:S1-C subfamily serine protease
MRTTLLALLSLACLTTSASGEDAISTKTLAAIKRATVFIKVDVQGLSGSGSGFVMKVDGDTALVVTNHHVVEPNIKVTVTPRPSKVRPRRRPPIRRLPPRRLPPRPPTPRSRIIALKNAVVTVVFDSGTKKERSVKAEVLAADPEQDLAILRVKDVKDLPKPIDYAKSPELVETMRVYTFGFPFGKVLATGKRNPALTVGKAAISSLRENDDGELAIVQIDGSLNPGNSGGPVVDSEGRLVGVAVATIRDSSGIGLAIPGDQLRKMLLGRVGTSPHLRAEPGPQGKMTVHVEFGLIDPLNKIKAVTLHYIPGSRVRSSFTAIASLAALPGSRKVQLTVDKQFATARLVLEGAAQERDLVVQAVYRNGTGKEVVAKVQRPPLEMPVVRPQPNPRPGPDGEVKDGQTQILGGASDTPYKDEAPKGAMLVGFKVGLGKFFNNDIIIAIQPIYQTAKGEVQGKAVGSFTRQLTVKAKAGYAVAGITGKAGLTMDGFSVTFMRIKGEALDPKDSYKSDWIGGKGGGRETDLGMTGAPVIGIAGKSNKKQDCTGFGLLLKLSTGQSGGGDKGKSPSDTSKGGKKETELSIG